MLYLFYIWFSFPFINLHNCFLEKRPEIMKIICRNFVLDCIHQKEFIINSSYHMLFTKAISNHQCELLTVGSKPMSSSPRITILAKGISKQEQMNLQFSSTCVTLLQASYAISWVLLNIENNFIHHLFLWWNPRNL